MIFNIACVEHPSLAFTKGRASSFIRKFSDTIISPFFHETYYGDDIYEITLFITLLDTFANVPPKKPRYIEYKEYTNGVHKKWYYFETFLTGNLYYEYLDASDERAKQILAQVILESCFVDRIPKRLKDFDRDAFKSDVQTVLQSQGLVNSH